MLAGRGRETFSQHASVAVAVIAPAATSAQTVDIKPAGPGRQPDALAVAADGRALVLPDRFPDTESQTVQVQAALRSPGTGFGGLEDVSGVQDGGVGDGITTAAASILPGGRSVAAWVAADRTGAANDRVRVSERDATPPVFRAVGVSASATAGVPVRLTATASDALSGPPAISWDFGDGSSATGPSVSHVFAGAGRFTVTVTATDTAGNTIRQTRVVTVASATAARDRTPPTITHAGFSPARFRTRSVLRLTLNKTATVVIDVRRGRRPAGSLVALSLAGGARRIAFTGRLGRGRLMPGTYAATITAIDGVGHHSRPITTRVTILRPIR